MSLFWIIALAGIGTYATRLGPMFAARWIDGLRADGFIVRFLQAFGLTAITSLIVVSVSGLLQGSPDTVHVASVVAGSVTVVAAVRVVRNVGMATLLGAFMYALVKSGLA